MKTMTCNQLGGACDVEFKAESFEKMAELSKAHAMEMMQQNDQAHLAAMGEMQSMMQEPGVMEKWFAERRAEFDALPDDS